MMPGTANGPGGTGSARRNPPGDAAGGPAAPDAGRGAGLSGAAADPGGSDAPVAQAGVPGDAAGGPAAPGAGCGAGLSGAAADPGGADVPVAQAGVPGDAAGGPAAPPPGAGRVGTAPLRGLISVVFPCHRNPDQVRTTLPALLNQQLPPHLAFEVIAVDDGSGADGTGAALRGFLSARSLADPRLRPLLLPANLGRSGARNAAVAVARGEVVVFLDSDVLVAPDFLTSHARALGLEVPAASGPLQVLSLGRVVDAPLLDQGRLPPAGPVAARGLAHFTTANAAIPRALLDAVSAPGEGPFDAGSFTRYGWEDLELECRLMALGPRRINNAAARALHHVPPFRVEALAAMIAKEEARADMAHVFLARHPRAAVRMMTQMTPLHAALWQILSLGGLLDRHSMAPLLHWLVGRGWHRAAGAIARVTVLNPAYMRRLRAGPEGDEG